MNTPTPTPTSLPRFAEQVLDKAKAAVCGPRNADYGPPIEDFTCQAEMMSAYLSRTNEKPVVVRAQDIPALMILVKMARQAHAPKLDNWVDTAGYAACGGEIHLEIEDILTPWGEGAK
jgi:hypothetical protein